MLPPTLHQYALPPYPAPCVKGGFAYDVVVYACRGPVVFFVSPDNLRFGAGTKNEFGDIVTSQHFPTAELAARCFIGMLEAGDAVS